MDDTKGRDDEVDFTANFVRYDPDNPPFQTLRLCIYLRELEEEYPAGGPGGDRGPDTSNTDCPE